MIEEWSLRLTEYNKNIIDLIIGKSTTLKHTHAALRKILFILTQLILIHWRIKMLKNISFMN